ncbi:MAG: hypothetical protein ACLRZ2_03810 [Veillonella sp.]
MAVKPQVLPSVLETLKEVPYGTVMISVAAGITLDTLMQRFHKLTGLELCQIHRLLSVRA